MEDSSASAQLEGAGDEVTMIDLMLKLEKTTDLLAKCLQSRTSPTDSGIPDGDEVSLSDVVLSARKARQSFFESTGHPTKVSLRVEFLKIGDVDTKKNEFTGDVLLEASWQEPGLRGKSDEELDDLEDRYGEIWDPKLIILNMDQAPRTNEITYDIEYGPDGIPVVYYRRKIRGSFFERLELRHFPFDVQELSLHIVSDHPAKQVSLELCPDNKSTVHTHTFRDVDEWTLFQSVKENVKPHASDFGSDSDGNIEDRRGHFPVEKLGEGSQSMIDMSRATRIRKNRLIFSCFVARNYGYWIFNVFTILLLINCLTFTPFAFLHTQTSARLGVMMSLLLTTVAKKMALGMMLPPISYLTYLDIYMMSVMGFLGLQATQFAVSSIWVKQKNKKLIEEIDFYSMIIMACVLLTFNIIYVLFVLTTAIAKRKRLGIMESTGHSHSHREKKTKLQDAGEREHLTTNESV